MAVTGWFAPGTVAQVNGVLSSVAFSNPDSVKVFADSNNATNSGPIKSGSQTQNLQCYNFGITIAEVPNGASINGIEVEVLKSGSTDVLVDRFVILFDTVPSAGEPVKGSGGRISDNKASGAFWASTLTTSVYGGASDLWGATTITDVMVRSSTFGFSISAAPNNTSNAAIDGIRLRIYYTEGTPPEPFQADPLEPRTIKYFRAFPQSRILKGGYAPQKAQTPELELLFKNEFFDDYIQLAQAIMKFNWRL